MRRLVLTASAAISLLVSLAAAPAASESYGSEVQRQLAEVRRATARYHDAAVAIDDGYLPTDHCVPGMGYHYVNPGRVADHGGDLEITRPAILVYAPNPSGQPRLVAVEYAVDDQEPDQPSLFGQGFDDTRDPLRLWTLHAWIWQANPEGMFVGPNRNITCPGH